MSSQFFHSRAVMHGLIEQLCASRRVRDSDAESSTNVIDRPTLLLATVRGKLIAGICQNQTHLLGIA